jgi:hypothetical protein
MSRTIDCPAFSPLKMNSWPHLFVFKMKKPEVAGAYVQKGGQIFTIPCTGEYRIPGITITIISKATGRSRLLVASYYPGFYRKSPDVIRFLSQLLPAYSGILF